MIVVFSLLFVLMIVRFYFYPDPCDYFRYSFRKTSFALSHYYIKTFFLVLVSILISPISSISFLPVIPCIILLIYTLAYKPYQDY